MNASFPMLRIQQNRDERQHTRETYWETEFEKNHNKYAKALADQIARQSLEKFDSMIKDPYKISLTQRKWKFSVSLEITDQRAAKTLKKLMNGCQSFAPFQEWLDSFSVDPAISDELFEENSYHRSRVIDKSYFEEMMALVGQITEKRLGEIFTDYQKITDVLRDHFRYSVKWYRRADHRFSNPSDFRDNELRIELWLVDMKEEKSVQLKKPPILEQHRIKQHQLKNTRSICNHLSTAGMIVVMIFLAKILMEIQKNKDAGSHI